MMQEETIVEVTNSDVFIVFEDFIGNGLIATWTHRDGLVFSGDAAGSTSVLLGVGSGSASFNGKYTLTKRLIEISEDIYKKARVDKVIYKMCVLDDSKYSEILLNREEDAPAFYGLYRIEIEKDGNKGMINDRNFVALICNSIGAITPQDIGPVAAESVKALSEERVLDFNDQMKYLHYRMGTFCKPGVVPPYFMVKVNDNLQNRIPIPIECVVD